MQQIYTQRASLDDMESENSWFYRDSNPHPPISQSVASRYTDYAIPASTCICNKLSTRNAKLQRKYIWKISETETDEAPTFPFLFSSSPDTVPTKVEVLHNIHNDKPK
jgi:hypothetical protein